MESKILNPGPGDNILPEKIQATKTIVFTNGCFDILHPGHHYLLAAAKKLGDILVLGLNTDDSVRRLKGPSRPVNEQKIRAEALSTLDEVDYIVLFAEDTPENLIQRIKPDVLVKGGDYKAEEIVGSDFVKSYGGKVTVIPILEGHSTTSLIEKNKKI